jgi:hypothetical protein
MAASSSDSVLARNGLGFGLDGASAIGRCSFYTGSAICASLDFEILRICMLESPIIYSFCLDDPFSELLGINRLIWAPLSTEFLCVCSAQKARSRSMVAVSSLLCAPPPGTPRPRTYARRHASLHARRPVRAGARRKAFWVC